MPAVISLSFDPVIVLSETASVRIETIALAVVLFGGLALAMRIGAVTPGVGPYVPPPGLAPSDLVLMVLAGVPGAIVGGRLGYVLAHFDFYRANPDAILDLSQGALTLTLAVPLGLLTGGIIGRVIGAPVGRWMHAAALPLLFVLGAGKLVGVLGATGQGLPSDLPWATAYEGPGPWGSLAPELPSHPAQVYEAMAVGLAMLVVVVLARVELLARPNGATLFVALALWSVIRFAVAFTWRDPIAIDPVRVEQLLSLAVFVVCLAAIAERSRAIRRPAPPRPRRGLGTEAA